MSACKFTTAMQAKIIGLVQRGEFLREAARLAGISRGTLFNWLRSRDRRYLVFQHAIRRARLIARFNARTIADDVECRIALASASRLASWGREDEGVNGMDQEHVASSAPA